jgi:hypothetical protein
MSKYQPVDPAIVGAAGASVVAGLIWKLVEKGTLTKQDALDIYEPIIRAKDAKAQIGHMQIGDSETEFAVQDILVAMVERLNRKFPD